MTDTGKPVTEEDLLAYADAQLFNGDVARVEDPPRWLEVIGDIFPLKHFVIAFREPLNPLLEGMQIHWGRLGYMTLWGIVAVVLAVRFFRWEPRAAKEKNVERGR